MKSLDELWVTATVAMPHLQKMAQDLEQKERQILDIHTMTKCSPFIARYYLTACDWNFRGLVAFINRGYFDMSDPDLTDNLNRFMNQYYPTDIPEGYPMDMVIKTKDDPLKDRLKIAFDLAEHETSAHFAGHTCSIKNKDGKSECPICYFRLRAKHHLGLDK